MARKSFWVSTNLSSEVRKAVGDITKYDEATQKKLDDVIRDMTGQVFDEAVSLAPKSSGKLAASIKQEFTLGDKGRRGYVKATDHVAHLIEFGANGAVVVPVRRKALHPGAAAWFAAHAVVPRRQPQPFMKPAMEKVRPALEAAVKEALRND